MIDLLLLGLFILSFALVLLLFAFVLFGLPRTLVSILLFGLGAVSNEVGGTPTDEATVGVTRTTGPLVI